MSTNNPLESQKTRKFTPNRILLIFIALIMTFTGIVVVASSNNEVKEWSPDTPQGTVQSYLNAMIANDTDAALQYLAGESACSIKDLDRAFVPSDIRVYLSSTKISGESASVSVKVDIPTGGPFTDYASETHTLRLTHLNSSWRITGIPWPLYDCGVMKE